MSRIGKKPVALPKGVTATVDGQTVTAKGPKGQLVVTLADKVTVAMTDDGIKVAPRDETLEARAQWGMARTLVQNIVTGVTDGFRERLEINGVGYRAQVQGNVLSLALGYSHDVQYPIPDGIRIEAPKPTELVISGIEKQRVGQVAAEIRRWRPPEPYKGKGVKYADEHIFRKEGKKK
jgi:large subunit ribosomal protein L6